MPILRHEHDKDFLIVPNTILRDERLALQDIGLLCFMLSLPEEWSFSLKGLVAILPHNGEGGIRASLKRIKEAGYLRMERQRDKLGKVGPVIWYVSDLPCGDFPHVDKPHVDLPRVVNPVQTKNRLNKEQIKQSTDSLSLPRAREAFVPPSLDEVADYCRQRGNDIDPKQFIDYFAAGEWKDRDGKPVRNWKQRIISWERQGGRNGSQHEKDHGQISGRRPKREYKVIYD